MYIAAAFQVHVFCWVHISDFDISLVFNYSVGRDGSVGTATSYELDGPGIKCLWWRDFQHPSRLVLRAYPASCTMGTGPFPGVKRLGRGVDHPPPSSAEVQERVELYLYCPSELSWTVLARTLPLLNHSTAQVTKIKIRLFVKNTPFKLIFLRLIHLKDTNTAQVLHYYLRVCTSA